MWSPFSDIVVGRVDSSEDHGIGGRSITFPQLGGAVSRFF